MLKRFPFLIGFTGSMLFFLGVNVYAYLGAHGGCPGDCIVEAGFPLRWYVTGFGSGIVWSGLMDDVSIAIITSFVAGLVIKPVFRHTAA